MVLSFVTIIDDAFWAFSANNYLSEELQSGLLLMQSSKSVYAFEKLAA